MRLKGILIGQIRIGVQRFVRCRAVAEHIKYGGNRDAQTNLIRVFDSNSIIVAAAFAQTGSFSIIIGPVFGYVFVPWDFRST